eukprot:gnl/TRDRNA2_/TRDRNA2_85231_c0_seq1.p1 gnl/TRDRNA2_/TRDRNA2_85231_c0~~gnl/TRDRNA2_/TRDRNA2_85231_c0_seq1.p1  ORF type:complete len:181 (-),score=23.04 gnl/TRDRNA2_/TRDRNA2_85231_c0_seq1:49-591(-)
MEVDSGGSAPSSAPLVGIWGPSSSGGQGLPGQPAPPGGFSQGPCLCFCDCQGADQCIQRPTPRCRCVAIEARQAVLAHPAPSAASGPTNPFGCGGAQQTQLVGGTAGVAGAGFGLFGDVDQKQPLTQKRSSSELGTPQHLFATGMNGPPLKKRIGVTLDIRGRYRQAVVDVTMPDDAMRD